MKKLFTLLLIFSTSVIATETITTTSPDFDKNDPDWVLVEDDCENPDGFCNQVYVKESEVINYKNKKTIENGLRAAESVKPTKTDMYHKFDNYFDTDNPPEKIHIWAFYSENTDDSNKENNITLGKSIISSLDPTTYELEVTGSLLDIYLKMGNIPIKVNREALNILYYNNYIFELYDPDQPIQE